MNSDSDANNPDSNTCFLKTSADNNSGRRFASGSMSTLEQSGLDIGRQTLSLVQLCHWLVEPERRLKVLAALADNCRLMKGGALVSKVRGFCFLI